MVERKKVELVSAAGDWASLRAAVAAGCSSVYFGLKRFNLRANAFNFDISELTKITGFLHKNNKKAYLTLNTIIYDHEVEKIKKCLQEAKRAKVDGVILWDMAVLELARQYELNIHLSTQASVANFYSLKKYWQNGVKRVVLARECRLSQIRNIAQKIKKEKLDCSLEAFIHGAMCVSVSGRCFLSELSFSKSANRGKCLQVCRREFKISDLQDNQDYILGQDHILSPKDLCTLDFLDQLILSGLDSFKIEGRRRSPEYIFLVTSVYREAIDAFYQGKLDEGCKNNLKNKLKTVYNRGFSSGFYFGCPDSWQSEGLKSQYEKIYLGEVLKFYKKINVAEIKINSGRGQPLLCKGQILLFIGASTGVKFGKADQIQIEHSYRDSVLPGQKCGIKLDFRVRPKDKIFIWQRKKIGQPQV